VRSQDSSFFLKEHRLKIGIAGTGRMGSAVAARLLELGNDVTVWNRSADKTRPLAQVGAKLAATPAQLASSTDLIITLLTDAAALRQTFAGPQGLLAGAVPGKLFVEMSTVQSDTERELAAMARAKGAAFIDCPVGGSVGPARDGKLFGFAGADEADFARARPVLEQMCRRLEHVGPVGAGASMKLAVNLPLFVFWQAFGEALSLCRPLGLDPARLVGIFADTSGGPTALKNRGESIAAALAGKTVSPVTFDLDSIRKDLRTMLGEAGALGLPMPVTERTLDCFDTAAREGLGASDCTMVPAHWLRSPAG
jgi:3-hydroxyisobutyrate dehydrogenase